VRHGERRRRAWCPALALLAALALSGALCAAAVAASHGDNGLRGAGKARPPKPLGTHAKEEEEQKQLTSPAEVSPNGLASELGSTGQVDPLAGLGIRNPVCDQPAQIQSRTTRLACESDGTPESNYPVSNYGFDIFISTGVTHPVGDITYGFATVLNGIWLGLLFVLKLILSLLGLAFGLNPFGDGQTMSQISGAVGRLYNRITDPWLATLIVCGGIWFAYKGLIKREVAAGVAGTLAAIAMLVLGLWVVHSPRESVGQLASFSDEVALGTISAPQSGSLARPVGSYAEAMSRTWSHLVEVPFAGLDFSEVKWALGPPPPEAVEKANEKFCDDFGALTLLAQLSNLGLSGAKEECAKFAEKRYGKPKRIIDLYLRSSPGSSARETLWDYFDGDERYKAKVAAQGGDGVLTRLSMLALFAIGLAGAILLLAWLAIRLFTQAAIAFVLLLAAPFALFFPMLGDSGRRAFKTWGLTLLGAIVAKVVYAAFLSIVLLGIEVLGAVDGPAGSATGFLLSCAFTWAIFLKRAELVGWMSIGEAERTAGRGFGLGQFAAMRMGGRVAGVPGGAVRGVARRAGDLRRSRSALAGEATRETAKSSLQGSARALADQRYLDARQTLDAAERADSASSAEGQRRDSAAAPGKEKDKSKGKGKGKGKGIARPATADARPATAESGSAGAGKADGEGVAGSAQAGSRAGQDFESPSPERYRTAKELIARVDRNESDTGERWSDRDLRRFEAEDRELLESSQDPADHAHRAGYGRTQFEALRGPERQRAEREIEKARKRDVKRVAVSSEVPGRIAGRRRQGAERMRQGVEGLEGSSGRPEQLLRLRRERRAAKLPSRRNLSRGG
jgi:hypothetical protein